MTWFFLAVFAALSISVSRLLQKILLADNKSDPIAYSAIYQFLTGSIILIYALISGFSLEGYLNYIHNMILMGFLYAIGGILLFKAIKSSEISNVLVFFTTNAIWSFLAAIIFLHDSISITKVLGVILIFVALVIVTIKDRRLKFDKGAIFALMAAFLFGIAFVNDAYIIGSRNVASYLVIAFIFPAILTLVLVPKSIKSLPQIFLNRTLISKIILMSFFYSMSSVAIFVAIQNGGSASSVNPINQTNGIITVLLSFVLLKERDNLLKKILGIILCFIGVILISQ